MTVALINPNLVVQRNDPLTTGIVYMPVSLAYAAAALREGNRAIKVIDAYAAAPRQSRRADQFLLFGLTVGQILEELPADLDAALVYAINLTNHLSTLEIVRAVKQARPETPLIVLENTQAVTAYSLAEVAEEFYAAGADYILTGEAEHRLPLLLDILK